MHIECTNCKKTFQIDEKLIPDSGRLLQCSKCDHQWFYNKEKIEKNIDNKSDDEDINLKKEIKIKKSEQIESRILIKPEYEQNNKHNKTTKSNKKKQKNNFLNTFLVLIISFVALVVIVDTFKIQIKTFYPDIENLLNSLYQTLTDIKLFFKDLIK
tara:strand:- start:938 stop:1405 length:468 start_codon:yes stop_codon:yes gene_type:complete